MIRNLVILIALACPLFSNSVDTQSIGLIDRFKIMLGYDHPAFDPENYNNGLTLFVDIYYINYMVGSKKGYACDSNAVLPVIKAIAKKLNANAVQWINSKRDYTHHCNGFFRLE